MTHGDSAEDYFGEAIIVRLTNTVRNPPSTKPSESFKVFTELKNGVSGAYYLVDKLVDKVTVIANTPNKFDQVKITRSEEEVSSLTNLEVCITSSNPVPAKS